MLSDHRVTTFLEFLETWKCQRIRLRSGKRPKLREGSGNLCSRVNLFAAAQQNNVPLYFIRTVIHFSYVMVTEIFGLICAFVRHIAFSFVWKSRGFLSVWIVVTL